MKENANKYVNLSGGVNLYSKEKIQKNNIELFFLETQKYEYKQFKNKFISNLSILDVIMFNSHSEIELLLKNYKLL